jgi:hypothetical protein
MKNIKFKYLFISLLSLAIVSCSEFTDGINDDPNNFTGAPGDLLIGQANLEVVKLSGSNASRFSGIFTDQFTGADRQYIVVNDYTMTAVDFDDEWDDLYADGLAQARLAEQGAVESGDAVLEGVAQIVQGLLLGEAAALWGDVPASEALDFLNFPNPKYDAQASVLALAQTKLSDGITNAGSAPVTAYGTPVYASNNANWGEIAHTLKARYYLVAKDYENALSEAKLGISSSTGDLVSSHSNTSGAKNLYYQFIVDERSGYLVATGSHMKNLIDGTTPRLLVTPGDTSRVAVYFDGGEMNTNDGGIFAVDAGFPIVSYLETLFIEAEADQRVNGSSAGQTTFNDIRAELASMYGGGFPATTSTGTDLLMEILEEKYLSMPGSLQIFHDVRRTNNAIGVPIKGTNKPSIPQRFLYPQIEVSTNTNFPGIVDLFEKTPVNQ